jgi:hypothetical protein
MEMRMESENYVYKKVLPAPKYKIIPIFTSFFLKEVVWP